MTIYYCPNIHEALSRAKKAGRGRSKVVSTGGITLRSGRRGFAVYKAGKIVALIDFLLKFIVFQYNNIIFVIDPIYA